MTRVPASKAARTTRWTSASSVRGTSNVDQVPKPTAGTSRPVVPNARDSRGDQLAEGSTGVPGSGLAVVVNAGVEGTDSPPALTAITR